jgi:hypothetical protein
MAAALERKRKDNERATRTRNQQDKTPSKMMSFAMALWNQTTGMEGVRKDKTILAEQFFEQLLSRRGSRWQMMSLASKRGSDLHAKVEGLHRRRDT